MILSGLQTVGAFFFCPIQAGRNATNCGEYDLGTKTTERLLQDGAIIQRNMRWSPDGSRLVLETNASGNLDLAYWSPSDPVLRELVSGPYNEGQPQWSPDGQALLYIAQNALWLMTDDEPPKRLIEPGLGSAIDGPRWSPDGKHILFATDIQGKLGYRDLLL